MFFILPSAAIYVLGMIIVTVGFLPVIIIVAVVGFLAYVKSGAWR
jgi:hypothetical protein